MFSTKFIAIRKSWVMRAMLLNIKGHWIPKQVTKTEGFYFSWTYMLLIPKKLLKKYTSCVLAPKLHQQYPAGNNQTIQTLLPWYVCD